MDQLSDEEITQLLEANPGLRERLHTCLSDGDVKIILTNQENIRGQLEAGTKLFDSINGSLDRFFELWEKHEQEINDLKIWKAGKEKTNGATTVTMRSMQDKDNQLEQKVDALDEKLNNVILDVAVIKEAVTNQEKDEGRKWVTKDNIKTGIIVGTGVLLISFFATFLWKTFILGI